MQTAVGGAVWIVVFAAALLTSGVTLTAGGLQGLLLALGQRLRAGARHTGWRDGETVRVSGVLEATDAARQAPFSGRPAAWLSDDGRAPGATPACT